ncbi:MAG: signal recognition particle protein [Bacteroides sp.]|nr:MAG: signal recognition particle protein [Bacteroides sp.]
MFNTIQNKIEQSLKFIKGNHKITEINIAKTLKEIKKALIESDVSYKTCQHIIDSVKQKAIGLNLIDNITPDQFIVKIIKDELKLIMGNKMSNISINNTPTIILLLGLQGVGKTTFAAKLALWIKDNYNKKVTLIAADIHRPAAIKQLQILGEKINIPVYYEDNSNNATNIVLNCLNNPKYKNDDIFIIDTAGRLGIDIKMTNEINDIKKHVKIDETLMIVDSMSGQNAINNAKIFNDAIGFTGIVMTKLDGDNKGGATISIVHTTNKPIKFISTGEKMSNIDIFYPDRMASRILGMGDVISLVEKAQKIFKKTQNKSLKDVLKNDFNMNDFMGYIKKIKSIGNIKELIGFLPKNHHLSSLNQDINTDIFNSFEIIYNSMTEKERINPLRINKFRINKISQGCGKTILEVNNMLEYFQRSKKIINNLKKNKYNTSQILNKIKKNMF